MPDGLVGRRPEREVLRSDLAAATAAQPRILLVTGEAGIGKSRLVAEVTVLAAELPGAPARVIYGDAAPYAGATIALGPFAAAIEEIAGDRASEHQVPTRGERDGRADGASPADASQRQFAEVLRVLTSAAADRPLVLVIEDVHWADESSRQLLGFLAVRLRDQRILIVATIRDDDLDTAARRWLTEIERLPRVRRLRLGRLSDADIDELVAPLLSGEHRADTRAAIVSAAGGVPLFARELAQSAPSWPPPSLQEAVRARLMLAPPDAVTVAYQVATGLGPMPHALLAATVRMPEQRLLAAVRRAVDLRLLVVAGDAYAFAHALTRDIVYDDLLPGERRQLHRRLAEAISRDIVARPTTDTQGSHAQLAYHWQQADRPERAAPHALTGARLASVAYAYPEAYRLYAIAVDLGSHLTDELEPGQLLEEAAQAAAWAGRPQTAVDWVTRALHDVDHDHEHRAYLLERLGRYLWQAGDPRSAVGATGDGLDLLADAPMTPLLARLLAAHATGLMVLGHLDAALPLADRAVVTARAVGAAAQEAHALATRGVLLARGGDLEAGRAELVRSFEVARRAGSVEDIARAAANHVYLLCTAGRFDEAVDIAREGRAVAHGFGASVAATAMLDNNAAAILVATGRWTEAADFLADLLDEAPVFGAPLQLVRFELAVGRGDDTVVREQSGSLSAFTGDPRVVAPLYAGRAEHALHTGDLAGATRDVLAGLAALDGHALVEQELRLLTIGLRTAADIAAWVGQPLRLAAGWPSGTDVFAERARTGAGALQTALPEVAAYATLAEAETARAAGCDDRAHWRAVADAWQTAHQPYREAWARLREAQVVVRGGRREQAQRALDACVATARMLGARPLLEHAERFAAAARLTAAPTRVTDTASDKGTAARLDLTDRELQVLSFLATGRTNRQIARALFISERTVAVHVSHLLDKLGVRNRTEAATAAAQFGLALAIPPPTLKGT